MSIPGTITVQGQVDNQQINQRTAVEGNVRTVLGYTANTGFSCTLTTRTDDNTGVVTVASTHSITTTDDVCIFWTDSGRKYRSGMDVTGVSGYQITVDGGDGITGSSVLPVAGTTGFLGVKQTSTLSSDPNIADLKLIQVSAPSALALVQLRTVPGAQATVNYLCDPVNTAGVVSYQNVSSAFSAATSDTAIGTILIYGGGQTTTPVTGSILT